MNTLCCGGGGRGLRGEADTRAGVIPPFERTAGCRPPGVHVVPGAEIEGRSSYTPRRPALLARLSASVDAFRAAGWRRASLDGRDVAAQKAPHTAVPVPSRPAEWRWSWACRSSGSSRRNSAAYRCDAVGRGPTSTTSSSQRESRRTRQGRNGPSTSSATRARTGRTESSRLTAGMRHDRQ